MNPCVEWAGYRDRAGYGKAGLPYHYAHRNAWAQEHGPIPSGMVVMHLCNNTSCVNVEHLRCGTQSDNIRQAIAEGRYVINAPGLKGEDLVQSKLSEDDVRTIRARRAIGETYRSIAEDYPITKVAVRDVCVRRTWKHVA